MQILKTREALRTWRKSLPGPISVGFVPTMGALHAGHLKLITESRHHTEITVASIFVNPLQFGPKEDFTRYPRPFEEDCRLLEAAGTTVLFAPEKADFYQPDHTAYCDVAELDRYLCGASRPGHFRGVCTVVLKLLLLVAPTYAYFGQKDIQQALILKRMVRDLDVDTDLQVIETVREASGLALSSRNIYLSEGEKARAAKLWQGLTSAKAMFAAGERQSEKIKDAVRHAVNAAYPTRIDYIELVEPSRLSPTPEATANCVLALAVYFGKTRLIDNLIL